MIEPRLLKVPQKVHSLEEMFGVISRLEGVSDVVAIVRDEDGVWAMVIDGTTAERMNWMLDRVKLLLQGAA
jgi:hypothetical protein